MSSCVWELACQRLESLSTSVQAQGGSAYLFHEATRGRGVTIRSYDRLLGRTAARTLTVRDDPRGLFYRVQINHDDPLAVAVWAQVAHGDLVGSSFAFDVDAIDEEWHAPRGRGILPLRILWRVKLIDVAPVTRPAYSQTTIQARHAPVRSVVRVLHLGTRGR